MICLLGLASLRTPLALLFILGHIAAVCVIFVLARSSSTLAVLLRHWFVLCYVPFCYKAVPFVIVTLGLRVADSTLARWDAWMFKTDPILWLSALQSGPLVEFLQIVYTMFLPGVLVLAAILWIRQSRQEFRYSAFLIAATFLISYLGYLVLPARGPRLAPYPPLHGLWTFASLQKLLDSLEGVQYDCFPSGHVAVVMVGSYLAGKISRRLFVAFSTFAALIAFSTVYLRYHYVIDVIAGAALALLLIAVSPAIYRKLDSNNSSQAAQEPV